MDALVPPQGRLVPSGPPDGAIYAGARATALHHVLQAVQGLPGPAVLVLDDLHEVRAAESLALIRRLVEAAPVGLKIAAAARTYPALGLAHLRAQGRCAEFGRQELGFSVDETRQALLAAGQPAEPHTAHAVVRRTEGWPAGVYLAALVAREGSPHGPGAAAEAIAGDDVYIADYFRDELLAREPPTRCAS